LTKDARYQIINDYAFPRIAGQPENWPEDVECTLPLVATVDHLCSKLEERIPTPVTAETLSASPGTFVPVLKFILKELEIPHEAARNRKNSDTKELPRLFSIFPNPSFAWRFVTLNAETVASMIPSIEAPKSPKDYNKVFLTPLILVFFVCEGKQSNM
jgi:hypothetical protein